MTLENLVVYGGIVLGFWLIGTLTFLTTGHHHRAVLHLDARHGAQETRYAPERDSWAGRLRHAFGNG
jgi:hypothetical protein